MHDLHRLQMRDLAETSSETLATTIEPTAWVKTIIDVRFKKIVKSAGKARTTHDRDDDHQPICPRARRTRRAFGSQLRRPPGWITLWRGLEKLLLILRGANKCG